MAVLIRGSRSVRVRLTGFPLQEFDEFIKVFRRYESAATDGYRLEAPKSYLLVDLGASQVDERYDFFDPVELLLGFVLLGGGMKSVQVLTVRPMLETAVPGEGRGSVVGLLESHGYCFSARC